MPRICYVPISSSAPRPLEAAYIPILLSEVEQEQRPSENGDREAIVVGGIPDVSAKDVSAKTWRRTFRQKNMPKRLRLKNLPKRLA